MSKNEWTRPISVFSIVRASVRPQVLPDLLLSDQLQADSHPLGNLSSGHRKPEVI